MSAHRFASPAAAAEEVRRARQTGRLQAAVGLARMAAVQFPEEGGLHALLAELYAQSGQQALAKRERILAGRFVGQVLQVQAQRQEEPVAASFAVAPPAARGLLATILPPPPPTRPPQVPPHQRHELLAQLAPLAHRLVELEAALDAQVPAAARDALHESRALLRDGQARLERAELARRDEPAAAITQNLGPAGHPQGGALVSRGPQVAALQRLLRHEHLMVTLSGVYDAPTQKAVYELQQRHGLPRTGLVDVATRAWLALQTPAQAP